MSCRGLPDNTPLSANLPLPGWTRAGERNGGSTFQHRIPRTALCRWPAAPPPHGAVAASGGSWSSLSPSPRSVGQSSRRNPLARQVPAVHLRCWWGDRYPPTTHPRPRRSEGLHSRSERQWGQSSKRPTAVFRARSAEAGRCLPRECDYGSWCSRQSMFARRRHCAPSPTIRSASDAGTSRRPETRTVLSFPALISL
jgi:hypothetical protein